MAGSWPFGADGALVIDGTTVTLDATNASLSKDYSSITIINGGILNILGGNWVSIGCKGNFTIDATSKIQANTNVDTTTEGSSISYTATAPDGTALSATTFQAAGGAGGSAQSGS